jgi:hypothetical protein
MVASNQKKRIDKVNNIFIKLQQAYKSLARPYKSKHPSQKALRPTNRIVGVLP